MRFFDLTAVLLWTDFTRAIIGNLRAMYVVELLLNYAQARPCQGSDQVSSDLVAIV